MTSDSRYEPQIPYKPFYRCELAPPDQVIRLPLSGISPIIKEVQDDLPRARGSRWRPPQDHSAAMLLSP